MTDIDELLSDAGITGRLSPVGANPVEASARGDVHYQATIIRGRHAIDVYCSTGGGRPAPSVADALIAAGRRATSIAHAGSPSAWARALDRDPEDPDVERWYRAQVAEADALRSFLGDDGFAALARAVAEEAPAGGESARPPHHDRVGYPARSDEMTFQEPAVVAAAVARRAPHALAAAAAAVAIGALIGAAAGRSVRRVPVAGAAASGGLIGLAAGALVARRLRRNSARDALETLADQRSAIETGRD